MINLYINILATSQNSGLDFFRSILYNMCSGIYFLVSKIFDLFFDITTYTMFDNEMIKGLFNRLFVIIGVFMLFKLCISFISYLINPESMNDKEKGIGKLFGRIIMMLVLLYLLMPLNSFHLWGDDSACNAYENDIESCPNETAKNIYKTNALYKSNGLLFGALYDVQNRIINSGAISELILGQNLSTSNEIKNLDVGKNVANTIHTAFLTEAGTCDSIAKETKETAEDKDDFNEILNYECTTGEYAGYYMFEYNGIMALIVGIGVLIIVFLFCFDVAIRMIKLGILRLLSPIPAISYIDPKSSRDGMFANYVKTLTSTYLDLFLRLAIIYLVIFILADIAQRDETLFKGSTGGIAKVIIYISLLFFAGQAPKFIQQALGIKSKGTGLGFGASFLGGALSGMISGAAYGGVWGGIQGFFGGANAGAQNQWAAQNGQRPNQSAMQAARDKGAQMVTHDRNTMGVSLGQELGGMLSGRIMNITPSTMEKEKNEMYRLEGKQRTAREDFYSNPSLVEPPYTKKAEDLKKKLGDLQTMQSNKQNEKDLLMAELSSTRNQRKRDEITGRINTINSELAYYSTDITKVQEEQAAVYSDYVNYLQKIAGQQKKKYESGHTYYKKRRARAATEDDPRFKGPNSWW